VGVLRKIDDYITGDKYGVKFKILEKIGYYLCLLIIIYFAVKATVHYKNLVESLLGCCLALIFCFIAVCICYGARGRRLKELTEIDTP